MTDRCNAAANQGTEKDKRQSKQQWQKRVTHGGKISQLTDTTKQNRSCFQTVPTSVHRELTAPGGPTPDTGWLQPELIKSLVKILDVSEETIINGEIRDNQDPFETEHDNDREEQCDQGDGTDFRNELLFVPVAAFRFKQQEPTTCAPHIPAESADIYERDQGINDLPVLGSPSV